MSTLLCNTPCYYERPTKICQLGRLHTGAVPPSVLLYIDVISHAVHLAGSAAIHDAMYECNVYALQCVCNVIHGAMYTLHCIANTLHTLHHE